MTCPYLCVESSCIDAALGSRSFLVRQGSGGPGRDRHRDPLGLGWFDQVQARPIHHQKTDGRAIGPGGEPIGLGGLKKDHPTGALQIERDDMARRVDAKDAIDDICRGHHLPR